MEWDEPKAKPGRIVTMGEDLSNMSVGELEERVRQLREEIARAEASISAKRKHSAAAAELFGKK